MAESYGSRQLKIPVTNLLKKVFTREKVTALAEVCLGEHGLVHKAGPGGLRLDLWLESSPDGIRVKGRITGSIRMECTRCLEEYRQGITIEVDEFYRRPGLVATAEDGRRLPRGVEVPEEDAYVIDEGTIDLNVLLNDAVLLSIPMKHLCREDCRGLCQVCGANLNQAACGCVVEDIDPRLEALRALLDREEG